MSGTVTVILTYNHYKPTDQKFQSELADDGRTLLIVHTLHMTGVSAQRTLIALTVKM
jgi:hypothetical protein